MDIRKIKKLIELLEESGLTELEVNEGEESVRLSRQVTGQPTMHIPVAPQQAPLPAPTPATEQAATASEPLPPAEPVITGHTVNAPMVGTLYTAPSPGAKDFVSVGQHVNAGDTICIIEAMKMFNEIEADKSGTVTSFLMENGQPVEFGQPICVIE
jgi:acetyl-CoA carboxylase biotin carboxyl carrier protein